MNTFQTNNFGTVRHLSRLWSEWSVLFIARKKRTTWQQSCSVMVFLTSWRIMRLFKLWLWLMLIALALQLGSYTQSQVHTTTDNSNNLCHDPIAFSTVWKTKWWPTRKFAFLLDVAEATVANAKGQARKQDADP